MSKQLEMPEGYAGGEWSFYNSVFQSKGCYAFSCGNDVKAYIFHNDGELGSPHELSYKTAQLMRLAPAMAEEIKRLREELRTLRECEIELLGDNTRLERDIERLNKLIESLQNNSNESMLVDAALAKSQAQEPETATHPGLDGTDKHAVYVAGVGVVALPENPPVTRRPFNLEAALRGEKVVTRDGREVKEIEIEPEHVGSCVEVKGYIDGKNCDFWHGDGHYTDDSEHNLDLFMEASV